MMTSLSETIASHFSCPAPRLPLYLIAGAASLGTFILLSSARSSLEDKPTSLPSPKETILPHLSTEETRNLPYPPNALPGARDVDSPHGSIRLYEWGPEEGERVLLIHGISTPSIALGGIARRLVEKGCRVMLFDFFGRGYSSAPNPQTYRYDSALYTTQILLCLQSSPISWSSFILIGYSMGGAIAADFTSYFPQHIRGLILIAPGGLIRRTHTSWRSKLLYSKSGVIPEWLIEKLVARRLWAGTKSARTIEPEPDSASLPHEEDVEGGLRSQAVQLSGQLGLLPSNPNSTVDEVVDWQITHHVGFVPAFISSIRYAPIHDQHHRWRIIARYIEEHHSKAVGLKEVWLVLGEKDPLIVAEEVVEDAKSVLGESLVRVRIVEGVGHEVAVASPQVVVGVVGEILTGGEHSW